MATGQDLISTTGTTVPTNVYPEGTLRNFAQNEGWSVTYDPTTKMVGVTNPTTGRNISFGANTGSQYGIGGMVNDMHTVSDPNALRSALNAQQPQYQSPYAQDVTGANSAYQGWLQQQPPAASYEPELNDLIRQALSRTFTWTPETDLAFQAAQKDITKSVMESMNARGLLTSTITGENVTGQIAKAAPQFQQAAYSRFQDEGSRIANNINMLMTVQKDEYGRYLDQGERLAQAADLVNQMDDKAYSRWVDDQNRTIETEKLNLDRQLAQYDLQQAEFDKNVSIWETLGRANNDVAKYFGVPVGTPSQSMREYTQQREDELLTYKAKLDMETKAAVQKARELNAISGSRTGSGKTTAPQLIDLPPEVATAYEEELGYIQTNADLAYLSSAPGKSAFVSMMTGMGLDRKTAEALYPQFVSDAEMQLQSVAKDQPKYKTVDTNYYKQGETINAQIDTLSSPTTSSGGTIKDTLRSIFTNPNAKPTEIQKLKDYIYNNIELVYGPEMAQQFYARLPQ